MGPSSGAVGDSLVFIFPLAPMLTFTSAVGKLNVRVLWHHHMLLQVIPQSYCQVFVKSYNFVFEKIDKQGSPVKSDQNKAISVQVLWVSFHHRSTPVLSSSHQKVNFLHYISVRGLLLLNVPLSLSRGTVFRRQKNPRRGYRPKIAGILFVCNEPEGKYYTVPPPQYRELFFFGLKLALHGRSIISLCEHCRLTQW